MTHAKYQFKTATEPWEFEAIHRLNYRTFASEIPQHQQNESGMLIDKYHDENTYFICIENQKLIGMVCMRSKRPFSLEAKMPDLESYVKIPENQTMEIRLMAIEKEYRSDGVFWGLVEQIVSYCIPRDPQLLLLTAIADTKGIYEIAGFKPIGPELEENGLKFQPMYMLWEFVKNSEHVSALVERYKKNHIT